MVQTKYFYADRQEKAKKNGIRSSDKVYANFMIKITPDFGITLHTVIETDKG